MQDGPNPLHLPISLSLLIPPIVILSLSLITHTPKLFIHDFYVPALNNSTNSTSTKLNTFIFVDLKLRNVMPFNALRYGDLHITFYYGPNRTLAVAGHTVPGFRQGLGKTAHRRAVVRTSGLPWEDAFGRVSGGYAVEFEVEVVTTVRLRRCGFYTRRRDVVAAARVGVDGSGEEVYKKAVRLR